MEKKETIVNKEGTTTEEKLYLGVSSDMVDMTEKEYEMTIPDTVITFLKVKAGDKLHFIRDESDKRIYVEKVQKDEAKVTKRSMVIEETDNLTVIEVGEIRDVLLEGWLPGIGISHSDNENAKIYIMQVGNHLEIGKAEVKCMM